MPRFSGRAKIVIQLWTPLKPKVFVVQTWNFRNCWISNLALLCSNVVFIRVKLRLVFKFWWCWFFCVTLYIIKLLFTEWTAYEICLIKYQLIPSMLFSFKISYLRIQNIDRMSVIITIKILIPIQSYLKRHKKQHNFNVWSNIHRSNKP